MKGGLCIGIIGKRPWIIFNVGCEGSFYNVAGTNKIPNYLHALSTLYAAISNELFFLETLFCIFFILKNAYRSLPGVIL